MTQLSSLLFLTFLLNIMGTLLELKMQNVGYYFLNILLKIPMIIFVICLDFSNKEWSYALLIREYSV